MYIRKQKEQSVRIVYIYLYTLYCIHIFRKNIFIVYADRHEISLKYQFTKHSNTVLSNSIVIRKNRKCNDTELGHLEATLNVTICVDVRIVTTEY